MCIDNAFAGRKDLVEEPVGLIRRVGRCSSRLVGDCWSSSLEAEWNSERRARSRVSAEVRRQSHHTAGKIAGFTVSHKGRSVENGPSWPGVPGSFAGCQNVLS